MKYVMRNFLFKWWHTTQYVSKKTFNGHQYISQNNLKNEYLIVVIEKLAIIYTMK